MTNDAINSTTFATRLTWNDRRWYQPSGADKAEASDTYASKNGFGHEEWLSRSEWAIDGWQYGFLQGAHAQRKSFVGKVLNVRLYTIRPSKERLYVGKLDSVEILSDDLAEVALISLERAGYLAEMKHETIEVGGNPEALTQGPPPSVVNIRFRPESLTLYDKPIVAAPNDRIRRLPRYRLYRIDPVFLKEWKQRTRRAWVIPPSTDPVVYELSVRRIVARRIEAKMQKEIKDILEQKYGEGSVEAEMNYRDLTLTTQNGVVLIEIKASESAKGALRAAIGQLLEYAFFGESDEQYVSLVVIGRGPLTDQTERYLAVLNQRFNLEIRYLQYPAHTGVLDL